MYGLTRRDLLKCTGLYLIAKLIPGCDNPNSPRNMEQILADSNDDNKLEEKVNTSKDNDSKFKGDYSTPEKAVISDFEAVQRGDSYEVLSNQHSKKFVDDQIDNYTKNLKNWAITEGSVSDRDPKKIFDEEIDKYPGYLNKHGISEETIKAAKQHKLSISTVRYKLNSKGQEYAFVVSRHISETPEYQSIELISTVKWSEEEKRWRPNTVSIAPLNDETRRRKELEPYLKDSYETPKTKRN